MTASAPNRPTGLTLAIVLLVFMGLWGLVTGGLSLSSALAGPQAAGDMVSRQMDLMQRLPGAAQTPELAAKMAEMGAGVAEDVSSVAARWHTIQLALAALGLLLGVGLLVGAVRAWGAHPRARRFLTRLLWIAIGFTAVRAVVNHVVTTQTMAAMRPLLEGMMASLPGASGGLSPQQIMALSTGATQAFAVLGALLAAALYGTVIYTLRRPDSRAWLEAVGVEEVAMPELAEG